MSTIIFDTETTGLLRPVAVGLQHQPYIIELGALKVDDEGKVIGEFSRLVKPPIPLPEIITKVTGLRDEDLKDAPSFEQVMPELAAFFEGATVLMAHNAAFDVTMLKNDLERVKAEGFPMPIRTYCTVEEYHHVFGRRAKLTELFKHFTGDALEQTHRALDDCKALKRMLDAAGWDWAD